MGNWAYICHERKTCFMYINSWGWQVLQLTCPKGVSCSAYVALCTTAFLQPLGTYKLWIICQLPLSFYHHLLKHTLWKRFRHCVCQLSFWMNPSHQGVVRLDWFQQTQNFQGWELVLKSPTCRVQIFLLKYVIKCLCINHQGSRNSFGWLCWLLQVYIIAAELTPCQTKIHQLLIGIC